MKNKIFLLFVILFGSIQLYAQRPSADIIEIDGKELIIQPVLHGTLVLEYAGKAIYIDPYGGGKAFQGLPDPDLIMITDIHGDHLNETTLNEIKTDGINIIAPQAVADQISDPFKKKVIVMNNGEKTNVFGINLKALPMYNLPESPDAKHVKGRGNGYLLQIGDQKLYISGDTADIPEMRRLEDIDIAFVCMNLPYTMNIEQAASAVLDFKPGIIYPYHYRGNPDMSDTEAFKKLVNDKNSNIEVRLRNWYPEYE